MEVDRIKFERTGGFVGMRIAADIEFDNLPNEQAREISELLDDLDFNELPEQMTDTSPLPDSFTYSVTIETEEWKHTVVTGESSAPEKLQELLQMLNQIARGQMRKQ
jgi:hypothetical protein